MNLTTTSSKIDSNLWIPRLYVRDNAFLRSHAIAHIISCCTLRRSNYNLREKNFHFLGPGTVPRQSSIQRPRSGKVGRRQAAITCEKGRVAQLLCWNPCRKRYSVRRGHGNRDRKRLSQKCSATCPEEDYPPGHFLLRRTSSGVRKAMSCEFENRLRRRRRPRSAFLRPDKVAKLVAASEFRDRPSHDAREKGDCEK